MKKVMLLLTLVGLSLGLSLAYLDSSQSLLSEQQQPSVGSEQSQTGVKLTYQTGKCDQDRFKRSSSSSVSELDYEVVNNSLKVNQQLNYVCCADIKLRKELSGNQIKIFERNEGGVCKCMCTYPVSFKLGGLSPGNYTLQIYGVYYEEYDHDYSLLNEVAFAVD